MKYIFYHCCLVGTLKKCRYKRCPLRTVRHIKVYSWDFYPKSIYSWKKCPLEGVRYRGYPLYGGFTVFVNFSLLLPLKIMFHCLKCPCRLKRVPQRLHIWGEWTTCILQNWQSWLIVYFFKKVKRIIMDCWQGRRDRQKRRGRDISWSGDFVFGPHSWFKI